MPGRPEYQVVWDGRGSLPGSSFEGWSRKEDPCVSVAPGGGFILTRAEKGRAPRRKYGVCFGCGRKLTNQDLALQCRRCTWCRQGQS